MYGRRRVRWHFLRRRHLLEGPERSVGRGLILGFRLRPAGRRGVRLAHQVDRPGRSTHYRIKHRRTLPGNPLVEDDPISPGRPNSRGFRDTACEGVHSPIKGSFRTSAPHEKCRRCRGPSIVPVLHSSAEVYLVRSPWSVVRCGAYRPLCLRRRTPDVRDSEQRTTDDGPRTSRVGLIGPHAGTRLRLVVCTPCRAGHPFPFEGVVGPSCFLLVPGQWSVVRCTLWRMAAVGH
jgi:hypothetical protein